jgi:hypothetical protein
MVYPIAFKTPKSGSLVLEAIHNYVGEDSLQIWLIDSVSNEERLLQKHFSYFFSSEAGEFENRIFLKFKRIKRNTIVENPFTNIHQADKNAIHVFSFKNEVNFINQTETMYDWRIIDLTGKTIYTQNQLSKGNHKVKLEVPTGIYIVNIENDFNRYRYKIILQSK